MTRTHRLPLEIDVRFSAAQLDAFLYLIHGTRLPPFVREVVRRWVRAAWASRAIYRATDDRLVVRDGTVTFTTADIQAAAHLAGVSFQRQAFTQRRKA